MKNMHISVHVIHTLDLSGPISLSLTLGSQDKANKVARDLAAQVPVGLFDLGLLELFL